MFMLPNVRGMPRVRRTDSHFLIHICEVSAFPFRLLDVGGDMLTRPHIKIDLDLVAQWLLQGISSCLLFSLHLGRRSDGLPLALH